MGEKTVTGGYHPLPPVPEDQICVSLNICIHSFMNYVIEAAPELTKNVYGLPALDPVRSKSREPVLSLIQVCFYFQQEALHEVILRILR